MEKEFKVNGMTCGGCVRHVTHALNELEGVSNVNVDLETGIAKVVVSETVTDDQIVNAVKESGYSVQ
ncbi:heavy-metal-associated domain-containing protein [Erysipelothrix sp. HDW6C]|uniref:heavy-metal-associated domain-containing protein n=1 Tax=Erysipelothrix sp. HDW6C TaxID=2714930 RepID=UPI0014078CED|nr:heavy metal-associated domain-containing protein [Erysipelothrix sp. HDW6C]QIK69617.1 heavy-metal-associated domain-containing protein [Erysipelothrix sp. HDW6C]